MNKGIIVEPCVLTKEYKAAIESVYDAWTQPQHLSLWQVPNPNVVCEYTLANIQIGGSALHKMTMPNGNAMWLLTQYHQLDAHNTISFTQYESNEHGDIVTPKMPDWPKEMRVTIELSENNGVTHLQFIWQPIDPSAAEAAVWEASKAQYSKGWEAGLAMLEHYLAKL